MAAKIEQITKRYQRTVSRDYQSWVFATELSASVIVNSADELKAESEKLFKQAKALTDLDIKQAEEEILHQQA